MDCVLFCVLAKIIRYRGDSAKLFVTQRESPGEESLCLLLGERERIDTVLTPRAKSEM